MLNGHGFAPGIYLDLNENPYHRDPALGSTDLRRLLRSGPDYWWDSWMNPLRPPIDGDTEARIRGKAMHKFVLEGKEIFDGLYVRRPDDPEGATSGDKSNITKAAKKNLGPGQTLLKGPDYDRINIAGSMVRAHPDLGGAFTNCLTEVSVFWSKGAVRKKSRFDSLKPRGIGDLKSITNTRGVDFIQCCRNAIANYRYDIQADHYVEGRGAMASLFEAGCVFDGATGEQITKGEKYDFLEAVVQEPEYAFVFVFFQSDDAPIVHGEKLSPENPLLHEEAHADVEKAVERFKDFMERFGPEQMWLLREPLQELQRGDLPAFYRSR